MATPAERKALLFFAIVATLGAGVRLWRASHHGSAAPDAAAPFSERSSGAAHHTGKSRKPAKRSSRASGGRRPAGRESSVGQNDRDFTSTVDIDRASVAEIDALGVLQPGMARLIVADRDSFGPFGSLQELERVPFLSTSVLRKLAPRVTFSRLPRPKNTVIRPRSSAVSTSPRRTRRGKGTSQ